MTSSSAGQMTAIDVTAWRRNGFLSLPSLLDADVVAALPGWAEEVSRLPVGGGDPDSPILQHFEQTDRPGVEKVAIARSENLVPNHEGIRALVSAGVVPESGAALIGEPLTLYKEKINYKLPGGAGFEPHQDATAYKFVDTHLTCMIAIDETTPDNGCLEVAAGLHDELLPTDGDGCIRSDIAAELEWRPIVMRAGSVLWFHSRTPHRSGPNTTGTARRALFLTYNAAAEGNLRQAYYDDKIAQLRSRSDDERVRVSTIGHFKGRVADSPSAT